MASLFDQIAMHAHYLEMYYNGVENKFTKYLRKAIKEMKDELLKTNTVTSNKVIAKKLDKIEDIFGDQYALFIEDMLEDIAQLSEAEAEFSSAMLADEFDLETKMPSPTVIAAAVQSRPFNNRILRDYLKDFPKEQATLVRNAVSTGFFEGKTTPDIVRDIVGTRGANYKDGILNVSRNSANRMVRTALSHVSTVAREKTYEQFSDVLRYYEWVSTLDSRTSPVCRARDGNVYEIGKGPLPPAHYNCRSTTAPLLDDEVEVAKGKNGAKILTKLPQGGTRASEDGQVSADLTYQDWLKKQSKKFQDDVLGPTRAKLFRDGQLELSQFINDRGQQLTLDELKSKFPTAWGKI